MLDLLLINRSKCKNYTPDLNFEKIATLASQLGSSGSDLGFHTRPYLSQLVPILVNSYLIFGQLVPTRVNSYLFWSTRTYFGQLVPVFGQLVPIIKKTDRCPHGHTYERTHVRNYIRTDRLTGRLSR